MEAVRAALTILESALTSAAIVVGGVWAYYLFWKKRAAYPRVALDVEITSAELPRSRRLVHVTLHITNTSDILLPLEYMEVRLRQVVPTPPGFDDALEPGIDPIPVGMAEFPWPVLVQREFRPDPVMELEPGESDSHHVDFVIDDAVRVAELYAFVQNPSKAPGFGWPVTRLQTFDERANAAAEQQGVAATPDERTARSPAHQPSQSAQQSVEP